VAEGEHLVGAYVGNGAAEAAFRGIPYAAPPVGDLRWKPPARITPRQGVQQATEFGPSCIQASEGSSFYRHIAETLGQDPNLVPGPGPSSENCLYLNVWTPNLGAKDLLPVMVWIHGGANANGTAAAAQTDGANLARKGAVVVSIHYRLNLFGFLAHPALTAESEHGSSGNYALLDQIAALQWVQRNAAAFGGDPGRVTVFGESAGGTDITYLLASPLSHGLFHRAVIESGGYAVSDFRTLGEAEAVGKSFGEALGVAESKDVLAAMRAASTEDLRRAWLGIRKPGTSAPNVDGWVLPAATASTFDRGEQYKVPVIVGYNRDEWTALRHYWPNVTLDGLRQVLRAVYGPLADRAMELYPATNDAEAAGAADRWSTDWYYVGPSRFIAERMARAGARAWVYEFSRAPQVPGGEKLGAHHGIEIPYVWDTLASEKWVPRQPWDEELADAMSASWVRFAATGDPNGGQLPAWPAYSSGEEGFLEFGDTVRAGSGVRRDACELYEKLMATRLATAR
jgi:para-nitrobenzyl esterase